MRTHTTKAHLQKATYPHTHTHARLLNSLVVEADYLCLVQFGDPLSLPPGLFLTLLPCPSYHLLFTSFEPFLLTTGK